jgi:5'(3')-deoxyribonucleotidase
MIIDPKKVTILVDIDDTIENLLEAWVMWLNIKYGYCVKWQEVNDWDVTKFYPDLTREQVFEPLHTESFWYLVMPKNDAQIYLKKLFNEGFNIYLCTSTDYRNVRPKYEAIIKKYFPYIRWSKVIVTSNKQMLKADYLIDDGPHNLEGGSYKKILFSAPHNLKYKTEENGMVRCSDWESIYQLIHDDMEIDRD